MKCAHTAIKIPRDAFDECPSCFSDAGLRSLSIDVFCTSCGWDSSSAFVDVGGLDGLMNEFEKQEVRRRNRSQARKKKRIEQRRVPAAV